MHCGSNDLISGVMDNDHAIMSRHLINSKGTNPEDADLVQPRILRSSSESSIDSRDIEKDDFSDSLLESTRLSLVGNEVIIASNAYDFNLRNEPSGLSPPSRTEIQSENYDPNRIPPSIFTSKPTTPMEWSVASNESLFSIHVGTSSFSRDNVLLYKSGESPETNNSPPRLSPVMEAGIVDKISQESKLIEEILPQPAITGPELPLHATRAIPEETKFAKTVTREHIHPAEEIRNSTSSVHSFHFPLLEANVGGNGSVKVVMENRLSKRQRSQAHIEAPVRPRRPFGSSWFSCFSCCSLEYSRNS